MKPIACFDSAIDGERPRWHQPMPRRAQRWMVKLRAVGNNGEIHEHSFRTQQPCDYGSLMRQHIEPAVDEMREVCGGVTRMMFWLYRAR